MQRDIRFYMEWGSYESDAIKFAADMKDNLLDRGYTIEWNIRHEGHSWANWRAHVDDALIYFFND